MVMSVNVKMTTIADAIREKTGGTEQLGLDAMATEIPKVYDAGYSKAEREHWDNVLNYGNRTDCEYAFSDWGAEYLRPPYKVMPTSRSISMFRRCKVKKLESQYFDLSNCSVAQAAGTSGHHNTFTGCTELEEIEDIGLPAGGYYQTFYGDSSLHTIAVLRVKEDTTANNAFGGCGSLENIVIDGLIGGAGFNFNSCTKLTHDSLMSIINHLQTKTSGTWTITLGATNLAKLTDAEKAIATEKGWTLA
jgi:hypothetical protein